MFHCSSMNGKLFPCSWVVDLQGLERLYAPEVRRMHAVTKLGSDFLGHHPLDFGLTI